MIYCPDCGTANREGSRFCNECGQRLAPEATVACPRCAVSNALDAAHCQECGFDLARARADQSATSEPVAPAAAGGAAGEAAPVVGDALPPWLDNAEREAAPAREGLDELSELEAERQEGRLRPEGWSPEAIPIAPIVGVPYRAYAHAQLPPTAEQEQAAKLFAAAAAEEALVWPQEVPQSRRSAGRGDWVRQLLAAALFVALLVPMLWPIAPLAAAPAAPAGVAAAAAAIDVLPVGAPVLVAFEYDAAVAGDLQPVAEAYLRHLLRRGARVLLVSTQPEGTALADMALAGVLAGPSAQSGEGALNLGYVAGGDAAVRALAMSVPTAAPAAAAELAVRGVGGARDLPLIVVLGRDLTALRRWIEQAGTPYDIRLLAGLPAQAGPAAEPYRAAGQLQGLVAGLGDAAAYERLGGAPVAMHRLGALRLGAWVLAAVIAGANLWALVSWVQGRRQDVARKR